MALTKKQEQSYQLTVARGLELCSINEDNGGFSHLFEGKLSLEKDEKRRAIPLNEWSDVSKTKAAISAVLMENTRQYLDDLDETFKSLTVGNFADHIFTMIRAGITNNPIMDLVSVQPMTQSIGRIFYLNYVVGQTKGKYAKGQRIFDAQEGYQGGSTLSDQSIEAEAMADATAATGYTGNLSYLPAIRGSVVISMGDTQEKLVLRDNGNGGFTKISGTLALSAGSIDYQTGAFSVTAGAAFASGDAVQADYEYEPETSNNLPQIDVQISAIGIQAKERAMRMRYSTNGAFDFKQQFGESPEALLISAVTDLLKAELAREVIKDLWNCSGAPVTSFSAGTLGGVSKAEHFADIIYDLNQTDGAIYSATQQAHGNWLVCDVAAANLIKSIPAPVFQAAPIDSTTQGVQYLGKLNGQFDVWVDKYLANERGAISTGNILMGHKGPDFRSSGYVYAPYQPITMTPGVTLDDLVTRRGINTRYAKKLVNPRLYKRLSIVA